MGRGSSGGCGVVVVGWLLIGGCNACSADTAAVPESSQGPARTPSSSCPEQIVASDPTPGTSPRHRDPRFWIARAGASANELLLEPADIARLNQASHGLPSGPRDLADDEAVLSERRPEALEERLVYMEDRLASGVFVEKTPESLAQARRIATTSDPVDQWRLVVEETQLFCVAVGDGLFKVPADPDFDRNACATLHPGERVRVLRRGSEGRWLYVHADYTVGWVETGGLSAPLDPEDERRWTRAPVRLVSSSDQARTREGFEVRLGVSLPVIEAREGGQVEVWVPTATGLTRHHADLGEHLSAGSLPLTKRAVFDLAFGLLDRPYGWGGRDGQRDCSRMLRDVLFAFGLDLARHSGVQALQGSASVDLAGMPESEKIRVIREAAAHGIVLLYMPGHIMLYLGEDGGQDYAISSISEWLEPCPGGGTTTHRLDRVAVTTLEIGRGTPRTSFIERLTRIAVFGSPAAGA